LADLFRAALVDVGARSTLRSELGLTEQYLRIEGLRLGVRLNVRWRVDGLPGHFELPSLILQPLVENCVYHGIEPLPQGGTIEITGRVQNEGVFIELKNAMPPGGSAKQGHGIAQANVEARLRAFFGEQVEFQAESREGNYVVTMHLPRAEALSA
jgi:two-component system sensor histidine kinase AlgZ